MTHPLQQFAAQFLTRNPDLSPYNRFLVSGSRTGFGGAIILNIVMACTRAAHQHYPRSSRGALSVERSLAYAPYLSGFRACANSDSNPRVSSRPHSLSRRSLLSNAAAAAIGLTSLASDPNHKSTSLAAAAAQQMMPALETTPPSTAPAQQQQHQSPPQPRRVSWGYVKESPTGPDNWSKLSDEYSACGNVGTQSPVAISYRDAKIALPEFERPSITLLPGKFVVKKRPAMPGAENNSYMFDVYVPPPPPMVGDAPPIDVHPAPESVAVMTVPGHGQFELRNFHFHAPETEHEVNGRKGSLELHFVFQKIRGFPWTQDLQQGQRNEQASQQNPSQSTNSQSARPETSQAARTSSAASISPTTSRAAVASSNDYVAAVLAIMFDSKRDSCPWLRQVLDVAFPHDESVAAFPQNGRLANVDLSQIIPDLKTVDLYTYPGSLTTPPGTEGVFWVVVGKRAEVSASDVNFLQEAQGGPNVRPLQPLGKRVVTRFPADL